ncbi:MAG: DNA polymerase III subunit delta [Oscillospiraceae bacterium]|nr:DNA polymerase III subunit delta [Oscillospiraceae bacterium]
MSLGPLLGNERITRAFLRRDRLPNAILIAGAKGSGKSVLARLMAQAMVCSQPNAPCLTCRDCRNVERGVHPDVVRVEQFIKKEDLEKDTIKVDPIRALRDDVFIRPNQAQQKVYLISRADRMNEQAQNALLKTLEEGPAYATFLLLADQPMGLLLTIRSRCFRYDMTPLNPEEALPSLRERFPDRSQAALQEAIHQSGGILGQAIALLEGQSGLEETTLARLEELLGLLKEPGELALMEWSVGYQLDKPSRTQLMAFFRALSGRIPGLLREEMGISPRGLMRTEELCRKAMAYLDNNGAAAHCLGWFAASLWELCQGPSV